MTQRRIHVIVEGRVQGVYYRASTQEQAIALNLCGWVRNLASGNVEFEAQGTQDAIDSLLQWARSGPARAQVNELICNNVELKAGETEFTIRR